MGNYPRVRIPLSPPFFLPLFTSGEKNHRKNYKSQDGKYDLLLRFFIFTFLLSAWRRKRDFFTGCLALLDRRSAMLTLVGASLRRRIPLSPPFFLQKNGGMKPSGFASWHAVPLHAFVRLTRRRRARHKALHILRHRRKMLHKKRLTMKQLHFILL